MFLAQFIFLLISSILLGIVSAGLCHLDSKLSAAGMAGIYMAILSLLII